jgi:hypothetical protein
MPPRAASPPKAKAAAAKDAAPAGPSIDELVRLRLLAPRFALWLRLSAAWRFADAPQLRRHAPQKAQAEAQRALAEAARAEAERADEAAASARDRAAREAKDREDVMEHAGRELAAAAAKSDALQASLGQRGFAFCVLPRVSCAR